MNIVLMPSAFFPSLGGVEELTVKLANVYRSKGHSVLVITNRWPKSLPQIDSIDGIPVTRFPFLLPERNIRSLCRFLIQVPSILWSLVATVRTFSPDVVHVVCCSGNLPYALALKMFLGIPVVVTAQGEIGMDASGLYQSKSFVPRHFKNFMQRASWITACSLSTQNELLGYSQTNRCGVIHNGIDIREMSRKCKNPRQDSGRPYVFAMGRHVYQKGFDVLIRAWHKCKCEGIDLVIGGDGTETEQLRKLVTQLNLEESVFLCGRLDRSGVVAYLQHAKCFVLPSRHEPFGIVVLEAMAARVPVIATVVGGVPEFVFDGINGRLVPGNNESAMASAISDVLTNEMDESILEAAYLTASTHDWTSIADEYLSVYSRVIDGEVQT